MSNPIYGNITLDPSGQRWLNITVRQQDNPLCGTVLKLRVVEESTLARLQGKQHRLENVRVGETEESITLHVMTEDSRALLHMGSTEQKQTYHLGIGRAISRMLSTISTSTPARLTQTDLTLDRVFRNTTGTIEFPPQDLLKRLQDQFGFIIPPEWQTGAHLRISVEDLWQTLLQHNPKTKVHAPKDVSYTETQFLAHFWKKRNDQKRSEDLPATSQAAKVPPVLPERERQIRVQKLAQQLASPTFTGLAELNDRILTNREILTGERISDPSPEAAFDRNCDTLFSLIESPPFKDLQSEAHFNAHLASLVHTLTDAQKQQLRDKISAQWTESIPHPAWDRLEHSLSLLQLSLIAQPSAIPQDEETAQRMALIINNGKKSLLQTAQPPRDMIDRANSQFLVDLLNHPGEETDPSYQINLSTLFANLKPEKFEFFLKYYLMLQQQGKITQNGQHQLYQVIISIMRNRSSSPLLEPLGGMIERDLGIDWAIFTAYFSRSTLRCYSQSLDNLDEVAKHMTDAQLTSFWRNIQQAVVSNSRISQDLRYDQVIARMRQIIEARNLESPFVT